MILKTSVDRLVVAKNQRMYRIYHVIDGLRFPSENATRLIARLAGRLSALFVVAGAAPASSSRLVKRPASRTPRRVQLRFPG